VDLDNIGVSIYLVNHNKEGIKVKNHKNASKLKKNSKKELKYTN